ncbi:hypothetical protein R6Q57_019996 [Mikania cordata]
MNWANEIWAITVESTSVEEDFTSWTSTIDESPDKEEEDGFIEDDELGIHGPGDGDYDYEENFSTEKGDQDGEDARRISNDAMEVEPSALEVGASNTHGDSKRLNLDNTTILFQSHVGNESMSAEESGVGHTNKKVNYTNYETSSNPDDFQGVNYGPDLNIPLDPSHSGPKSPCSIHDDNDSLSDTNNGQTTPMPSKRRKKAYTKRRLQSLKFQSRMVRGGSKAAIWNSITKYFSASLKSHSKICDAATFAPQVKQKSLEQEIVNTKEIGKLLGFDMEGVELFCSRVFLPGLHHDTDPDVFVLGPGKGRGFARVLRFTSMYILLLFPKAEFI